MQAAVQTKNSKESSGICFSREDKAVVGLGPAAYWRYVRSPRSGTNAVFHRSCTFGTVRPPENKFRSGYWANVVSTSDYYPFGMGMVERGDDGKYRYGFNGMQRDDEWQGAGNAYDFGARMYDGRLGRWMSVDPLAFEYSSTAPFAFSLNTPIQAKDPDGEKTIFVNGYWNPNWPKLAGEHGGRLYWGYGNLAYFKRAQEVLNDVGNSYEFVDGRGPWSGSPVDRYESGYEYAKANFSALTADMKRDENGKIVETMKFVSHSQGGAYSEGMIKYLEEKGVVVETVVHLSTFQPLGFAASTSPNTYQLDLEYDKLTLNKRISGVDRFGLVKFGGPASEAHWFTKARSSTWDMVEDLIKFSNPDPIIINTGTNPGVDNTRVYIETGYFDTPDGEQNKNGTVFTEINEE